MLSLFQESSLPTLMMSLLINKGSIDMCYFHMIHTVANSLGQTF